MNFNRKLDDLRMTPHDVFDCAWKNINPANRDHVIDAAPDSSNQPRPRTATRTWLTRHHTQIAGAIANQRHADTAQVREHQFALVPFSGRLESFRTDDL